MTSCFTFASRIFSFSSGDLLFLLPGQVLHGTRLRKPAWGSTFEAWFLNILILHEEVLVFLTGFLCFQSESFKMAPGVFTHVSIDFCFYVWIFFYFLDLEFLIVHLLVLVLRPELLALRLYILVCVSKF